MTDENEFKIDRKKKNNDFNKLLIKSKEDPNAQFQLGIRYYTGKDVEQNYEEAIKWFTKSAKNGNSKAQYNLAVMYENGEGVKEDLDEAIKWYKESAQQGNNDAKEALKELGLNENDEEIINNKKETKEKEIKNEINKNEKDDKEKEEQISKLSCPKCNSKDIKILSEEDDEFKKHKITHYIKTILICAIPLIIFIYIFIFCNTILSGCFLEIGYILGIILVLPIIYIQDHFEKMNKYYKKGYLLYCSDCQNIFKDTNFKKGLIHKSDKKCLEYFLRSARNGNYETQYHLGMLLLKDNQIIGIKKDYKKAKYWFEKSIEYGNTKAENGLKLLENEIEEEKTEQVLEKIQQENWYLFNQGNNYYNGTNGVEQDYNKAIEYYTQSAEQGYSKSQYLLATIYEKGEVVQKDIDKAIKYYIKTAQTGDIYDDASKALKELKILGCEKEIKLINPEILFNLGIHESNEKNFEESFYWFTKSAELDYALAQYALGTCYKNGEGTEKNFEKAVKWYKKSAESGNSTAQYNLGEMYENGKGCEKDIQKAFYWYKKSAEQGYECAECKLGRMYYNGIGIEKDEEQAKYWFTKSAEKGKEEATYYLYIGEMYENVYKYENYLEKDYEKAFYWYKKSAELGNEYAKEALNELKEP